MKKFIFLLATGLGLGTVAAQQATVNVRLYPIQTIIVNPGTANQVVNLDYHTAADYANGVNTDKADHLSVYSTGAFAVSVKADAATLESAHTEVTENINSSDIWVTASAGSTNTLTGVTYEPAVSLTQTAQELFSSTTGGVNKNFNVNYAAKGDANDYVNKYFNVENPTVYTTTVTYSIEAR